MKDSSATDPEPFTTEEYGSGNVLYLLQQIYFFTSQESRQHEAQLSESLTRNLIEGLEAWITKGSRILADNIESGMNASSPLTADLNIPLWNYFHGLYTHLDVCRYMKPVLDYLTDENRKTKFAEPTWLAARVAAIRKECKSLSGNVLRSATNLRGKLRGPAALDEIKRGVLGHSNEIEPEDTVGKELRCLGNDSLIICRNIQESWIEALDGVIQTKIT